MDQETTHTRSIAIGSQALVRGFQLIGFEAFDDPDDQAVRDLVEELQKQQQRAFLVVEQYIANKLRDVFSPIQQEGGDILMVEVPSIHEPGKLDSFLSTRIAEKLGSHVLNREAP